MDGLADDDDLLSCILVDMLEFVPAASTHKMNPHFRPPRFDTEAVVAAVRKHVVAGDVGSAVTAIQRIPAVSRHVGGKDANEMRVFDAHIRRYLDAYLPDAGFEYAATHRYDAIRQSTTAVASGRTELCLLAVRNIRQGELVPHCRAALRDLSQAEDEALRDEAHKARVGAANGERVVPRDFSIIRPSSRGCSQLLLGPARFINHDCRPNSEFRRTGHQITIRAIRPIARGDEITVYYGDNYFELGNSECMCATCERRGTGVFASENNAQPPSSDTQDSPRRTRSHFRVASPPPVPLAAPPGAGPECICSTCGTHFWAPEKWWTPDECPRCERHYKIFEHDWPHRSDKAGETGRRKVSNHTRESSESSLSSEELPPQKPQSLRKKPEIKPRARARSNSPRRRSRYEVRSDESDEEFEKSRKSLGPKILGQGARTDVLAAYWGAPEGGRRQRRRTEPAVMTLAQRNEAQHKESEAPVSTDSQHAPRESPESSSNEAPIATKGKERTSELNLARFWSTGVLGRTRQQARRSQSERSTLEGSTTHERRDSPRISRQSSRHASVEIKERQDTPSSSNPPSKTSEHKPKEKEEGNIQDTARLETPEMPKARSGIPRDESIAVLNGRTDVHIRQSESHPNGTPERADQTPGTSPPDGFAPRRVRRNLRWGSGKVSYSRPLPPMKHENM